MFPVLVLDFQYSNLSYWSLTHYSCSSRTPGLQFCTVGSGLLTLCLALLFLNLSCFNLPSWFWTLGPLRRVHSLPYPTMSCPTTSLHRAFPWSACLAQLALLHTSSRPVMPPCLPLLTPTLYQKLSTVSLSHSTLSQTMGSCLGGWTGATLAYRSTVRDGDLT